MENDGDRGETRYGMERGNKGEELRVREDERGWEMLNAREKERETNRQADEMDCSGRRRTWWWGLEKINREGEREEESGVSKS